MLIPPLAAALRLHNIELKASPISHVRHISVPPSLPPQPSSSSSPSSSPPPSNPKKQSCDLWLSPPTSHSNVTLLTSDAIYYTPTLSPPYCTFSVPSNSPLPTMKDGRVPTDSDGLIIGSRNTWVQGRGAYDVLRPTRYPSVAPPPPPGPAHDTMTYVGGREVGRGHDVIYGHGHEGIYYVYHSRSTATEPSYVTGVGCFPRARGEGEVEVMKGLIGREEREGRRWIRNQGVKVKFRRGALAPGKANAGAAVRVDEGIVGEGGGGGGVEPWERTYAFLTRDDVRLRTPARDVVKSAWDEAVGGELRREERRRREWAREVGEGVKNVAERVRGRENKGEN